MSENIKLTPLAAESLGVRSMCTYVQTPDTKILVDPGASLGQRFGLLPHPREYTRLAECREKITRFAAEAEVVTISHYHYDHGTPTFTDYEWNFSSLDIARQIYSGKTILAKDARANINASQRRRGWMLEKAVKDWAKEITYADGRTFAFGGTRLTFSAPVFHGETDTQFGWVLMLTVEYEDARIVHASDVQGPISEIALESILAQRPSLVYVGGPPLYLMNYRVSGSTIERGMRNLEKLAEEVPTVIFDHHLLRDAKWREAAAPIFDAASRAGHRVVTAAGFLGEEDQLLEARRKTLYRDEPPSEAFNRWLALPPHKRSQTRPPI